MNAATRKKLFAYAIPVDLVIVATGVGLVIPGISTMALLGVFVAAVALSAWKSGWIGALAAILLSSGVLLLLFGRTVQQTQIGWFAAAGILVTIPLAALGSRLRQRSRRGHAEEQAPYVPMIATRRSVEETAAEAIAGSIRGESELAAGQPRLEGERLTDERPAIEKRKMEEELTRAREQIEREQVARFERRRAELQAAYDRERTALKAKFDAATAEMEAGRNELQRQLEEERRRPAVIEKHVDEEALAQRLEHLRAELQQQFDRDLQARLKAELTAQRKMLDLDSQREIEKVHRAADERVAAMRAELEGARTQQETPAPSPASKAAPEQRRGMFTNLFSRGPKAALNRRPVAGDSTAARRAAVAAIAESSATRRANAARSAERKPRVLFLEARRATADTAAPRLRQLGIEIVIVERLVDAVDEIYRFRPDVLFVDSGMPDFEKAYKTLAGLSRNLPLVLTARNASSVPDIGRADVAIRPYDIDEIVELARTAHNDPQSLLARQNRDRADLPPIVAAPSKKEAAAGHDGYDVVCDNCRVAFDATEADWCGCLTRERTVVCTNCLTCFCKAAPGYKETFWMNAPRQLFEHQLAEHQRQSLGITPNLPPGEVKRPLVMFVEDDEGILAVMQRICANLGYGSVSASNGRDGLELARTYRPNLILSDAFLPGLDGREMCRLLKENPALAATRMVVMTGLYADMQCKNEGLKRFRIDDYLVKPVSVTDLINLLQRHLEGTLFLPAQENLHELHRKEFAVAGDRPFDRKTYEVACAACGDMFDAVTAEWCSHAGDSTFVCEHCGNCFCNAPDYRQRFWAGAPSVLFERKMIVAMRDLPPAANPPSSGLRRPSVALVENDEAIQLMVRTVLSALGYGCVVSGNLQEAETLVREYNPDLILADAWTPNLDGREVCRQLKGDPSRARVKTIVMTGHFADGTYRQEASAQFQVDDCVPKPLTAGDLLEMVRKHLPAGGQA